MTRRNNPPPLRKASPATESPPNASDWRAALSRAWRHPAALPLAGEVGEAVARAHAEFPVRVPTAFANAIRAGDRSDPLLRQVAPSAEESRSVPGFVTDPVGDLAARGAAGVIHKYHGRVLLIATGACAIHCRYCFRRHFPYAEETAARGGWREALDYLARHTEVREVILSGGDPLLLDTPRLARLGEGLQDLPHIIRLRIHSRLPSVLPERIDDELLDWLKRLPLQRVVVTHVNHARELGDEAVDALSRLRGAGVTLLNQSVLLRGVNDRVEDLCTLSEALMSAGVLPYYLHQLDPVAGTAHFQVDDERARELMDELRRRLPGFLVPRLVREVAGAAYKLPLL